MYKINALLPRLSFGNFIKFTAVLLQRLTLDRHKTKSTSTGSLCVYRWSEPSISLVVLEIEYLLIKRNRVNLLQRKQKIKLISLVVRSGTDYVGTN